jgi:citrate/tricarballylate utilization protein
MELRDAFTRGDVSYLANLCHDCRACHQACMYTEPHEFALNLPALLAEARAETYSQYTRPRWVRPVFERGPAMLALATLASVILVVGLVAATGSLGTLTGHRTGPGAFYEIVAHWAMAAPALLLSSFAIGVAGVGLLTFWRESGAPTPALLRPSLWRAAFSDVATMRGLSGGGGDCYYPDWERPDPARRVHHQLVMYGFLATFGATVAAFLMESVGNVLPPYPVLSAPVLLGLTGGIASSVGAVGLLVLKQRSTRELAAPRAVTQDVTFIVSLLLVSITGLALLMLRDTGVVGIALVIHLATVFALYLTAPYGKFVHASYRLGALLRSALERSST